MPYTYEFPMTSTAVTIVILRDTEDGQEVLIGRRSKNAEVCPNELCAPGGFLDASTETFKGENATQAAVRETKEETGLDIKEESLCLFAQYSDPEIDPRAHIINLAFCIKVCKHVNAIAGDDLDDVFWVNVKDVRKIEEGFAFNHLDIIETGVKFSENM